MLVLKIFDIQRNHKLCEIICGQQLKQLSN